MKNDQYKHLLAITLLAFFLIATLSLATGRSSASASPPGLVRLALQCPGNTQPGCNSLGITAFQTNRCQLPATFTINVFGGTPRDTAPQFIITVVDPAGNPVPIVITSPDGTEATFEGQLAGTYVVTVQDKIGCIFSPSLPLCSASTVPCCSLAEQAYGNCTSTFDGVDMLKLIRCLDTIPPLSCIFPVGDPLQIGLSGLRSLTFNPGSERCLIESLPASGIPASLPASFGDEVINSPSSPTSCQMPADCQFPAALLSGTGKFNNALAGQTLALTLNTRIDGDIGFLKISNAMVTRKVLPDSMGLLGFGGEQLDPGPDGILGTPDDPITGVTIPVSVINAIAANSPLEIAGKFSQFEFPGTVNRVLKLANLALAGETNLGATFVEINSAVAAINRAFDHCSFVTGSFDSDVCLQDGNGWLSFNSTTGDYIFTRCGAGGFSLTGIGKIVRKGCTITLQHNTADRRILATVDNCQKKGTASAQSFPRGITFSITDRNTTDNTCACR